MLKSRPSRTLEAANIRRQYRISNKDPFDKSIYYQSRLRSSSRVFSRQKVLPVCFHTHSRGRGGTWCRTTLAWCLERERSDATTCQPFSRASAMRTAQYDSLQRISSLARNRLVSRLYSRPFRKQKVLFYYWGGHRSIALVPRHAPRATSLLPPPQTEQNTTRVVTITYRTEHGTARIKFHCTRFALWVGRKLGSLAKSYKKQSRNKPRLK